MGRARRDALERGRRLTHHERLYVGLRSRSVGVHRRLELCSTADDPNALACNLRSPEGCRSHVRVVDLVVLGHVVLLVQLLAELVAHGQDLRNVGDRSWHANTVAATLRCLSAARRGMRAWSTNT